MKTLILFPMLFLCISSMSQSKKETTNNIKNLKTLNVYGKENIPMFGVDISLTFDKNVNSVDVNCFAMNTITSYADNNKKFFFKAGQVNKGQFGPTLRFTIKSNEKIITKISGLAGKLG